MDSFLQFSDHIEAEFDTTGIIMQQSDLFRPWWNANWDSTVDIMIWGKLIDANIIYSQL